MRVAHKVKKEILADLSPWEKIHAAEHGDNDCPEARAFFNNIENALWIKGIYGKLDPKEQPKFAGQYDSLVSKVLKELGDRVNRRDSEFFHAFADAIYRLENRPPSDRAREYIGVQIEAAKAFGLPLPTPEKLYKTLTAPKSSVVTLNGKKILSPAQKPVPVSKKTVERICKEFQSRVGRGRRPRSDN